MRWAQTSLKIDTPVYKFDFPPSCFSNTVNAFDCHFCSDAASEEQPSPPSQYKTSNSSGYLWHFVTWRTAAVDQECSAFIVGGVFYHTSLKRKHENSLNGLLWVPRSFKFKRLEINLKMNFGYFLMLSEDPWWPPGAKIRGYCHYSKRITKIMRLTRVCCQSLCHWSLLGSESGWSWLWQMLKKS